MFYDSTLDDDPILLDDPPCLELVTTSCEDKNDILAECETKNSMVLYDNQCYYDETNNVPLLCNATSELIDDNKECCLNMLYDNSLDDGPMLIDNPPCLELVTTLCEDKNDILVVCENTLTNESPTLFLNSPNNTIGEKFSYVEKYLCGLQSSLVQNLFCNHDT